MEKKQSPVRNINAAADSVSMADVKVGAILQCRILRNGKEVAPDTILESGDTVQLRLMTLQNGSVRVEEGSNLIAEGQVTAGKALDTPRLTNLGSGAHELRVLFMRTGATEPPVVMPLRITYK